MRNGKMASRREVIVYSNLELSGSHLRIHDGSEFVGVGEHEQGLSSGLEEGLCARGAGRRLIRAPSINKTTRAASGCQ